MNIDNIQQQTAVNVQEKANLIWPFGRMETASWDWGIPCIM